MAPKSTHRAHTEHTVSRGHSWACKAMGEREEVWVVRSKHGASSELTCGCIMTFCIYICCRSCTEFECDGQHGRKDGTRIISVEGRGERLVEAGLFGSRYD